MNVLVVGGAGYVGGAVTDLLMETDHEVLVYDALLYEEAYRKDVEFTFGDVRDQPRLKDCLNWADGVIWLAAIVGDGACAISPDVATQVNYETIEFLVNNFDGRIIFPSSCSVYGASDGILDEQSATNPLSLYASLKLKSEALFTDKNALVFRLGTLFGLGDDFARPRLDLVVNTLTAKAVKEKKLRVFGGDQYRPLLHVYDAAQAMVDGLTQTECGIYNLHQSNVKIIDLAHSIQEAVPDTVLDIVETSFEDSRNYRATSDKASTDLWFTPTYDVASGVAEVKKLIESGRIKDPANARYTNQGFLSKVGNF